MVDQSLFAGYGYSISLECEPMLSRYPDQKWMRRLVALVGVVLLIPGVFGAMEDDWPRALYFLLASLVFIVPAVFGNHAFFKRFERFASWFG